MPENENYQGSPPTIVNPTVQSVVSVRSPGGWQIDRSVGIAIILGIVGQLGTGLWYAAGASSQLSEHEKRLTHIEIVIDDRTKARDEQMGQLTNALGELRERLASIESGVKYLTTERDNRR